jgi:hypothetical protein
LATIDAWETYALATFWVIDAWAMTYALATFWVIDAWAMIDA